MSQTATLSPLGHAHRMHPSPLMSKDAFSDLPPTNSASYPDTLSEVSVASIRAVMLHYAHGGDTSPRQHIIAAGLEMMVRVSSVKDISLRQVIERAGYGFSRFYKLWPSMEHYHHDVWRFGLKCHSQSELEHLRQLGASSLDDFADVVARHAVLAQHLVSPAIFRQIMVDYAQGDMMTMLAHTPEHARASHSMFVSLFPEQAALLPLDNLLNFAWMAATYLFTRLLDEQRSISDDDAIATVRSQLLFFRPESYD